MNYIKSFSEYIDYFRQLANNSPYFNFFQAGGAERIVSERLLSDGRSRITGPLMFCEWPFIKIADYGSQNNYMRYTGAFVILENPDKDDWGKQDEAMNSTYNAVLQVINQLKIDSNNLSKRFLHFDLNLLSMDPIENLMIDSWYGWRCEFTVLCPADIAINEACLQVPTTFNAWWGWQANPFSIENIETFTFQKSASFEYKKDIVADFTGTTDVYLALKYPATEPAKNTWYNVEFNSGTIPDQVFEQIFTKNNYRYTFTRVTPALDAINKKIIFS